jgi:DNA mismatch repair protein MSH2
MTSHPFKSAAELIAFRKLHATLKDRLPTTVWVFEIGDMYVLCDPDAQHATASLPPTNLRRFDVPSTQGNDIKMISVLAAKYSQRLLQHILLVLHYRVEIYRFKGGNYAVALQGSPCDLSELKDVVFGSESDDSAPSTNGYSQKMLAMGPICSIVLEGDSKAPLVGVCSWHEASRTTKLAEFYDNTGHDMLESLLVQFGPMEAVIANQPKYRTVTKVLERNKILVTVAAPKKASLAKSEADIEKCLNNHLCESKKVAFKAFAVLHQHVHVDLTDMVAEKGAQLVNIDDFVHLNWQADSGLNLLGGPGQPMSLFKVLNKTRTSGGERLLRVWLRQPLTDRLKIEERLGIVEEFVSESGTRKTLHDSCLRRIPDLEGLSVKLEDKKATLQDMYKCYIGAKEVGKVAEHLSQMDCKLIIDTFVMPLTKKLDKLEKFIELVDTTLDMEAVASDNVFMVKASFDNDLMELAEKRNKIKADINASVAKVAGYVGLDQKSVKLELTNQHGYTFRVTMKDEKSLRKKTSDIMIVDTHKTGVRFRDRRLEQLNRSYLSVSIFPLATSRAFRSRPFRRTRTQTDVRNSDSDLRNRDFPTP